MAVFWGQILIFDPENIGGQKSRSDPTRRRIWSKIKI
jgi:hypothetical protein